MITFLQNLHQFFLDPTRHKLQHKVVFAPGTAPMKKGNSEVEEILFATDFEIAYFVDPVYSVEGKESSREWDMEAIRRIDSRFKIHDSKTNVSLEGVKQPREFHQAPQEILSLRSRMTNVSFYFENKKRVIIFLAGDATVPQFQPELFTIFFSGRRIGLYPGVGLRATPSEYLHEIVQTLPLGGYLVPDRALLDDSVYFVLPSTELGLEEVVGIRSPIPRSQFPQEYSEDARFIHGADARGVGLYKKVREV